MWLELCCLSIGFLGKAGQGRQGRGGAIYVREQQGCTELFWGTEDSLTEGLWVTIRGEASDQYLETDEVFFTQLKRLNRSKAKFLWIGNLALLDSAEKDLGI